MTSRDRLGALDALRGFAALWVVLHHFAEGQHMPTLMQALPRWVVTSVFRAGELGVSVFFVLSGVVMVLTVQRVRFDGHNAARFVWRRLVRLWPPYAAAVALGLVTALGRASLFGSEGHPPSAGDVRCTCSSCKTWPASLRSRRFSGRCAWRSSSTSSSP